VAGGSLEHLVQALGVFHGAALREKRPCLLDVLPALRCPRRVEA
jgi:hypothetical protein